MSYVARQTEPELWTVGHYDPSGEWHPESDHDCEADASDRVAVLNGSDIVLLEKLAAELSRLRPDAELMRRIREWLEKYTTYELKLKHRLGGGYRIACTELCEWGLNRSVYGDSLAACLDQIEAATREAE